MKILNILSGNNLNDYNIIVAIKTFCDNIIATHSNFPYYAIIYDNIMRQCKQVIIGYLFRDMIIIKSRIDFLTDDYWQTRLSVQCSLFVYKIINNMFTVNWILDIPRQQIGTFSKEPFKRINYHWNAKIVLFLFYVLRVLRISYFYMEILF